MVLFFLHISKRRGGQVYNLEMFHTTHIYIYEILNGSVSRTNTQSWTQRIHSDTVNRTKIHSIYLKQRHLYNFSNNWANSAQIFVLCVYYNTRQLRHLKSKSVKWQYWCHCIIMMIIDLKKVILKIKHAMNITIIWTERYKVIDSFDLLIDYHNRDSLSNITLCVCVCVL